MVDSLSVDEGIFVDGAQWASVAAGIKKTKTDSAKPPLDVALLALEAGTTVSAVFTQNAFCAAPVTVAKNNLAHQQEKHRNDPLYCLINAGNANAGTGQLGLEAAIGSCELLSERLSCSVEQVIPFSTGVIGELLPVEKIRNVADELACNLGRDGWQQAAEAIMTTDTRPKLVSKKIEIDGKVITIAGITKGAGMIKPNMATMLSYIVTDADVSQQALDFALASAVNVSFNRITVDGDTSTNDACLLAATGCSGVVLEKTGEYWNVFQESLSALMTDLAMAIIRDAEGASKFITINIMGGMDSDECLAVGYTVAESPLVKTAFFASDANWGRILAAVGRAPISDFDFDIDKVKIFLADHCICEKGGRASGYQEGVAMQIMAQSDIDITIDLGRGGHAEIIWTSDLSLDYVRINADYRT